MSANKTTAQRRLCVWAENPEQRRFVQEKLPKYRRSLMPLFYHGDELINIIQAGTSDGIIFHSPNTQVVLISLRQLEQRCPACSRFVVCSRTNEAEFRSWEGFPPTILKEDESPEAWTDRVERAITVNQWLMKPEFRMVLPRLRTIPSLPASYRRVVEALRSPNFEIDEVAQLISQDVSLTAQLLKVVNSAALGLANPVNSISAAISVIGVVRLQSLVMSAWAFSFADEKMCHGFSPAAEWRHALAVATTTRELGLEKRAKSALLEEAFTGGILHDIGKLMLAANSPEAYADIIAIAKRQNQPLWQTEKELLGYSHAELGGCLLGLWGLDLSIVEAVAGHHDEALGSADEVTPLTLVYAANLRSRAADESSPIHKTPG